MDIAIILLLIGGLILTLADVIMKRWISDGSANIAIYAAGLAIYLVGLMFLVQSFKYKNIAVASAILVIVNVAILSIVSWFYFKETLSAVQISGLILGVIAVVIMDMG